MIRAPGSQAQLARSALGGASTASRLAATPRPARLASALVIPSTASRPSRSFTVSSVFRQDAPAAPAAPAAVDTDATPAPAPAPAPEQLPTSGRKKRGTRQLSAEAEDAKLLSRWNTDDPDAKIPPAFRQLAAKYLLKWGWFDTHQSQHRELVNALESARFPEWLREQYELAKSFRSARARLWTPNEAEIRAYAGVKDADPNEWLEGRIKGERQAVEDRGKTHQLESWDLMDYEQQVDYALRKVWSKLSKEKRAAALLRVRYECIRKLGWRHGYSSGYPRPEGEAGTHLPDKLGMQGDDGWAAFRKLQAAEEPLAWEAWQQLSPEERMAEERAAWKLRDRSQLYIDDSEDSMILSSVAPRWYAEPERAGELTFLPNTIVKLVKNHTLPGHEYDAFKATFRVPLSMHKHALRSYLLSIYGLKTTWARSAIYRSPITRDNRTGKKITGRGRTYKKVEVGLLEPFLFPEVSPEFQKQHLLTSELDYERARVYLKMTKSPRWRGKKSTQQYEDEIANRDAGMYHGLDPLAAEGVKDARREEGDKFPRFMVKTKGLPSAKHGKILQLLAQERKDKEDRINALIHQYKHEASVASKS